VHDAPVNAFDGAGKPYKGPSYKGGIAMVIVVIVGVGLSWLIVSAAFDTVVDTNPPPGNFTVQDPP
jgi:hypothetical protein